MGVRIGLGFVGCCFQWGFSYFVECLQQLQLNQRALYIINNHQDSSRFDNQTMRQAFQLLFALQFFKILQKSQTTTHQKSIQNTMNMFIQQNYKNSLLYIELIYLKSAIDDKQLKITIAAFMGNFIQDQLLIRLKQYGGGGGGDLAVVVNCWCNLFGRIVDMQGEDLEFYKEKFVGVLVRTRLELEDYCFEEINKTLQSAKFYFQKHRISIGLYYIKSILRTQKLSILPKKSTHQNHKKFKHPEILQQIITLLIDQVYRLFTIYHQQDLEQKMHETVLALELLQEGMEFQLSKYFRKSICTNMNLEVSLKQGWYACKLVLLNKRIENQEILNKILNNILRSGIKIFQFSKLNPTINISSHKLLEITSQLYHLIIQKNPILTQNTTTTNTDIDESIYYINSTAISLILLSIDVSTIMNSRSDGQRFMEFKGGVQYVFQVLVEPIFVGFRYLFQKVWKNQEQAEQFANMLFSTVLDVNSDQTEQILESEEQPILIAYIRLLNKLSKSFPQLRSTLKTYLHQHIQSPPPTNPTITETNNLIKCLILNSCLCSILVSDKEWLIFMRNLPYRAISYFTRQCMGLDGDGDGQRNLVNCLYLINLYLYLDQLLVEPNSDCGLITQLTKKISQTTINTLPIQLSTTLVQKYYKTYQFPYQTQKNNINLLLKSQSTNPPTKILLNLQLTILEFYKQLPLELCLKYIQELRRCQIGFRELINICRRVDRICREFVKNQMRFNRQKKKYLKQCILLSFQVSDRILKISTSILFQTQRTHRLQLLPHLPKLYKQSQTLTNQIIHSSVTAYNQLNHNNNNPDNNPKNNTDQIISPRLLIYQLQSLIQLTTYLQNTHFQQFTPIFLLAQFLPDCKPQLVVKIWRVCVRYLGDGRALVGEFQNVCKMVIVMQIVVEKLGGVIGGDEVLGFLGVLEKHVNRKNKLIVTDKAYLYRGKLYTIFIMLLKIHPELITNYLTSLQFHGMQQNFHPISTAQTYKSLLIEIFFTARNYVPHYDLPLVLSYILSLLMEGLNPSEKFQLYHSKYLHMYVKLLIEGVQRLYIWKENGEEDQHFTREEQENQGNYINMEIDSCYKIVVEAVNQAHSSGWKVQSVEEIMREFIKLFDLLKGQKQSWLQSIIRKFIKNETMQTVHKIYSKYSMIQPTQKYKNRTIVSVKRQQ